MTTRLVALVVAATLLLWAAPLRAAAPTAVTFRTTDGVQIAASFYPASRRPAPCVILVHMLTRSRDDWQAFASRLSDAGIAALAIDLRGHGGSSADPRGASDDLSSDLLDVQAARAFLARSDLGVTTIGVAGASIGAALAVLEGAGDPAIRSIVLLSPGLDVRGLHSEPAMRKYGDRPALMLASQEDSYATQTIRRLEKAGNGVREVHVVLGAGHGTVMLTRQPDLMSLMVEWFQRTL